MEGHIASAFSMLAAMTQCQRLAKKIQDHASNLVGCMASPHCLMLFVLVAYLSLLTSIRIDS